MTEQLHRYRFLPAVAVTLLAIGLYGFTLPTHITFEDAGLFDSVCHVNGIAHPPGYPLFTMICVPVFALPFNPAVIGNAISAVFGALTCGLVVETLLLWGCRQLIAATGGLLLAVSNAFWSQSIIVEVYTLNTFLFLLAFHLCVRYQMAASAGKVWLICLVVALGLANHWPLMVLSVPGLAIVVAWTWAETRTPALTPGFIGIALGLAALGLSPYLTLLIKEHPVISYAGPIDSLAEFKSYVLREYYAGVDRQAAADWHDKVAWFVWVGKDAARQFTVLASVLIIPALAKGYRVVSVPVLACLVLTFLLETFGLVALLDFDFDYITRATFKPYPLVAFCCIALLVSVGFEYMARKLDTLNGPGLISTTLVTTVAAAMIALTIAKNYPENNRRNDTLASDYSSLILGTLAKNAALVVSSDPQTFTLAYQQYVEGMRSDVTLYQINNLIFPDHLDGNTRPQRLAALTEMSKTRTVCTIGVDVPAPSDNYGLFRCLTAPGETPAAHIDPRHTRFRRRVIDDYLAGRINDPGERFFSTQLLLGFTNELLSIDAEHDLDPGSARDLGSLLRTFPGILALLSSALSNPRLDIDGERLLRIALAMEGHIPEEAGNRDRSFFYYYLGLLFLQGERGIPPNDDIAEAFLLKSYEVLPTTDNPGLCALKQTRLASKLPEDQALPAASCD